MCSYMPRRCPPASGWPFVLVRAPFRGGFRNRGVLKSSVVRPRTSALTSFLSLPGSMGSVQELEQKAQELRSLSRHLDQQHRDLKRKAGAQSGPSPATPWVKGAALRVLALADFDVAVCMEYLRWKRRRADEAEVQTWCAALSTSDRQCLLDPPDDQPRVARQLAEARKFMKEKALVSWVQHQNRTRGIAPSPGAVLDEAAVTVGVTGRRSSRYKWLRRITKRWGGRKAVFRVGDRLSAEVFEHKAGGHSSGSLLPRQGRVLSVLAYAYQSVLCAARILGQGAVRFLGPLRLASLAGASNLDRLAAPLLGPQKRPWAWL